MASFNKMKTPMRYKFLGGSGIQVSEFSFGCMTFSDHEAMAGIARTSGEDAYEMMKTCFEHGINFFDNAENYGGPDGVSERIMGDAIQKGIERGTWRRKDLIISTKLFGGSSGIGAERNPNAMGLSRKHLTEGLLESLRRMGLDYVDLLFCHRPDPAVRIEETVRTMNDLIRRGLCFYWGTSEWSAQQLQKAIAVAERLGLEPPLFDQCQYSLVERRRVEVEYEPLYPDLGLTIWSPLAGGALSGKYKRGVKPPEGSRYAAVLKMAEDPAMKRMAKVMLARFERSLDIAQRLAPIAEELRCTPSQLALAWAAANPRVSTVILGASTPAQLKENLAALRVIGDLSSDVLSRIEEAAGTRPEPDEIMQGVLAQRKSRM